MDYQWDIKKAASNLEKHGINFTDAVGVFEDEYALTVEEQIVDCESRFITIGVDFLFRILVVIYTFKDDCIRIISARNATKRESKIYGERRI